MEEGFYSSVKVIKGQRGVEAISGKWICELEELLATGGREVEEVKAYISTNSDFYRKPYDRRPQDNPRHCIFIGTTNRSTFLTDLSGNRRWFPVEVHSNARDLYKHESEIKYDIEQCWAEMLHAYETGEALARPVENYELIDAIRGEQERAQVDDHRVGLIGEYLQGKNKVCLFQIWRDCLHRNDYTVPRMERRDSVELASIVTNKLRWRRGGTEIFPEVGRQKAFYPPEN
jgi:predicted P-loop ATPase